MYTEIGMISGKILDLLEQRNGLVIFGDIHSGLKEPHDLILMSLGWLIYKEYVFIIEDPLRGLYQDNDRRKPVINEVSIFDLVVGPNVPGASGKRIKNMSHDVRMVAGKVLTLLEGCRDLLNLQTIEALTMHENREIVLMALGCLIREGYVKGTTCTRENFFLRLPKEIEDSDLKSFCHV